MKKYLRFLFAVIIMMLMSSVAYAQITLEIGQTTKITADQPYTSYPPIGAVTYAYTFEASNSSVVSISGSGQTRTIKALKSGTTDIYCEVYMGYSYSDPYLGTRSAYEEGWGGSWTIVVKPKPPTAVSIPSSMSLEIDQSKTISVSYTPSDAGSDLTWNSSNTSVAEVSSSGKVTGVSAGTATITVTTANGLSDTCKVTVTTPPLEFESVSPESGSDDVEKTDYIRFRYSHSVYEGSYFSSISLKDVTTGKNVPITVTRSGTSLKIAPNGGFAAGHKYTATVPAKALKNYYGGTNATSASTTFTVIPLVLSETIPEDGDDLIQVSTNIVLEFEESLTRGTYFSSISLKNTSTNKTVAYTASVSGNKLTISPTSNLEFDSEYILTVPVGALKNGDGFAQVDEYTVTFSTQPGALAIASSSPKDYASDVDIYINPKVEFSYYASTSTNYSQIALVDTITGKNVAGTVELNGKTLTFIPYEALDYKTKYRFIIPQEALENEISTPCDEMIINFETFSHDKEYIAPPTITLNGTKAIITAEEGTSIYYTTDGSDPAMNGKLYTSSFTLPYNKTLVKAVAVKNGVVSKQSFSKQRIFSGKNFGGSDMEYFSAITVTEDGYVAAGHSYEDSFGTGDWTGVSGKGELDAIIVKYDKDGNVEWKKNFGGIDDDEFKAITAVEDGFVAAGYSWSFGNGDWTGVSGKGGADAIIVKYDKNGNMMWKSSFGGRQLDFFEAITAVKDGYVAAGYNSMYSFGTSDLVGAIIVKFDKNGNVVWESNFVGGSNNFFNAITAVEDGYVAAGHGNEYSFDTGDWTGVSGKGSTDAIIVKYDKDGNVEWKKNFGGIYDDEFNAITTVEDGFVAAGYSYPANGDWAGVSGKGGRDTIIVKYDKNGNVMWKKNFGGSNDDEFYAITAVEDGFVAAGVSYEERFGTGDWAGVSSKGGTDAIIVKYDKKGNVEWKKNFGGSDSEYFEAITATEDGFVAAGYSFEESFGTGDWSGVSGKGWIDAIIVEVKETPSESTAHEEYIKPVSGNISVSGKDEIFKGDTLTVPLYFMPDKTTTGANAKITYPSTVTYTGFSTDYADKVYIYEDTLSGGKALNISADFSTAGTEIAAGKNCVLAVLTFKVSENAPSGDCTIGFDESETFMLNSSYSMESFDTISDYSFTVKDTELLGVFILGKKEISKKSEYIATSFPANAPDKSITWSVSDNTVASVDENGVLTPIKNGTVTLMATAVSGVSDSFDITISGISTYINSLKSDTGRFAKAYAPEDTERVLYVPSGTSAIKLTASFTGGSFVTESYGAFFNDVAKNLPISALPQTYTFTKKANSYDDTIYKLTVMEADYSVMGVLEITDCTVGGGKVTLDVELSGLMLSQGTVLVTAVYNEEGRQISATYGKGVFDDGNSASVTVDIANIGGRFRIKCMLLESMTSLAPVASFAQTDLLTK